MPIIVYFLQKKKTTLKQMSYVRYAKTQWWVFIIVSIILYIFEIIQIKIQLKILKQKGVFKENGGFH